MKLMLIVVTENEITHGVLSSSSDPNATCLCIMRDIVDINSHLAEPTVAKFIDVQCTRSDSHGAVVRDSEATALLSELRQHKLGQRLGAGNITSFQLNWQAVSVQPPGSTETSSSSEKSSSSQDCCDEVGESETTRCDVVGDDHERYIASLCDDFYNKLTTLIRRSCHDDDDDDAVTVSEAKTSSSTTDAEAERNRSDVDVDVSTDVNASGTADDAATATHDKDRGGNSANIEREGERNKDRDEKVTEIGRKANRVKRVDERQSPRTKSDDDERTREYEGHRQRTRHSVSSRRRRLYHDDVAVEVLQHLHFARSRCEVFHGRQGCLEAIVDYVSGPSRLPMIVYGRSGCGKTSVMAKVVESVALWAHSAAEKTGAPVKRVVTVVRFLGTTAMTSNVRDLLESVCRQLIAVYTPGYVDHFYVYHILPTRLCLRLTYSHGSAWKYVSPPQSLRVTGIVEL